MTDRIPLDRLNEREEELIKIVRKTIEHDEILDILLAWRDEAEKRLSQLESG